MHFVFNVEPTAKGRPRMGRYGVYTPTKTRNAEDEIVQDLMLSKERPLKPTGDPVIVHINFTLSMPKSWSQKKRSAFKTLPHTSRPDLDNLIKLVTDSANGILYLDDSQIVELHARKSWGEEGQIELIVKEV